MAALFKIVKKGRQPRCPFDKGSEYRPSLLIITLSCADVERSHRHSVGYTV